MFRKIVFVIVIGSFFYQMDVRAQYRIAKGQLGYEMQNYYRHPSYHLLRSIILTFEDNARETKEKIDQWPMIGFLTSAISKQNNPEVFKNLADSIKYTKELVLLAIAMSIDNDTIAKWETHSPGVNDMLWGAFFATADTVYLSRLVSEMAYCDEQKDLMLYITGASAKLSLCSNAQSYPEVNVYLKELFSREFHPLRPHIQECLLSTVAQLKEKLTNGVGSFNKK